MLGNTGKSLEDIIKCPQCGSEECYQFDVDEIEFASDLSHSVLYYHCQDCDKSFRVFFKFRYEITDYTIK